MLRYLYFLVFVLTLSFGNAVGSTPVKQTKKILVARTDTTNITVRHFNASALKNYSNQKEFKYNDESYDGISLWTRFWRWVWSFFKIEGSVSDAITLIVQYVLIALGVAALIFLILKLAGIDALNIIRRKPSAIALPYDELVENIHEMDLDSGIETSVQQHNYRLAVRLLYLKSLKQLSDAGHIVWDINKTNHTYVKELTNTEQRMSFNVLTRQFEYIWYGQFNIDAKTYTRINTMFADFKVNRV